MQLWVLLEHLSHAVNGWLNEVIHVIGYTVLLFLCKHYACCGQGTVYLAATLNSHLATVLLYEHFGTMLGLIVLVARGDCFVPIVEHDGVVVHNVAEGRLQLYPVGGEVQFGNTGGDFDLAI